MAVLEKEDKFLDMLGYNGYMQFNIGKENLYVNFKSRTENFNIEEVVKYNWDSRRAEKGSDYEREYGYQITYCRLPNTIDYRYGNLKGRTSREITAKYDPNYWHFQDQKPLTIKETTWINGKLRTNRTNNYDGTIEEAVKKQQMGIDAISHLRYRLNSILPFKQEIMKMMLSRPIPELKSFFPDLAEEPNLSCDSKDGNDELGDAQQKRLLPIKSKPATAES